MADESFAGVGTPEYVALKLLEAIAEGSNKATTLSESGAVRWDNADKDWVLDTYAECLQTVLHRGDRLKKESKPYLV